MSGGEQTIKLETLKSASRGAAQKNGPAPEGPSRSKFNMLQVAEKPAKGTPTAVDTARFYLVSDLRKAQLWLDEQIGKAGSNVTTIVGDLTPELASVLLERNPANRALKDRKVEDYAKDIKTGAWKFNGEPIIIASDGLLNDGQHRCAAVLEAQKGIKSVMVFGVSRDSRDTLDQGVNRTVSDYLAIHGHSFTANLASAAKMVWQWRNFGFLSDAPNYRPTRSEVLSTALENPAIEISFQSINRGGVHVFGSASVLAFAHFAFGRVSPSSQDVTFFFDCLIDGANLKAGDPILGLRNRLIADRKSLRNPERAELLFRAWNAHRLEQTRVLYRLSGGELPLLEA